MRQYIARRLIQFVPTLVGVSLVVFLLLRVIPGDVATLILMGTGAGAQPRPEEVEKLREQLGLNRPLHVQYLDWAWGMVRLDPGKSMWTDEPVINEIRRRFPLTLELAILTSIVSLLIAMPIGVLSAMRQDTWVDYLFRTVSIAGLAMPTFWTGTLIILALVILFNWMPPLGAAGLFEDPQTNLQQLIWPSVALGYYLSAIVSRMIRSQMLEVLREDYIRTARAKGLRERLVVYRHALKNAILPVVTIVGIQLTILLGGAVIIETVFVLPGMGANLVDAIFHRDYTMVQAVLLLFAVIVLVTNLLVDIMYGWLDPRIRYQ